MTIINNALQQSVSMFLDCIKSEVLWENASPLSAFPGQNITVNLAGAKYVMITFRCWYPNEDYTDDSVITEVGVSGKCEEVLNLYTDGLTKYFLGRWFSVSKSSITIQSGKSSAVGSTESVVNNNYMSLYKIIAIYTT